MKAAALLYITLLYITLLFSISKISKKYCSILSARGDKYDVLTKTKMAATAFFNIEKLL